MPHCFRCNKQTTKHTVAKKQPKLCKDCYRITVGRTLVWNLLDLVWDLLDAVESHGCQGCDELPRDLPEFQRLADAIGYTNPNHPRNEATK